MRDKQIFEQDELIGRGFTALVDGGVSPVKYYERKFDTSKQMSAILSTNDVDLNDREGQFVVYFQTANYKNIFEEPLTEKQIDVLINNFSKQ